MSNKPPPVNIDDVLAERGKDYNDAWLATGELLSPYMADGRLDEIIHSGYFYAWITILCKLVRALASPRKLDNWVDIVGYAQLVVDHLETGQRGR
jgi:hypothetical protein